MFWMLSTYAFQLNTMQKTFLPRNMVQSIYTFKSSYRNQECVKLLTACIAQVFIWNDYVPHLHKQKNAALSLATVHHE